MENLKILSLKIFTFIIYRNQRANLGFISPRQINQAKDLLRHLQLQLNFFNLSIKSILYISKQICLIFGILGGFSAIKLASSDVENALPFCLIYIILFNDAIIIFISIFNPMFQLTNGAEELKKEILVRSTLLPHSLDRREVRMFIRSVPQLAVRSGRFKNVERESTLLFIDFIGQQISALLISFP